MAKIKMTCPFSGKVCKDCAFYRGRHYYMCFSEEYRGHVDEPGSEQAKSEASKMRSSRKFEMPRLTITKAHDPFRQTHRRNQKES